MSDKEWYLERDTKPSLYGWIFSHMAVGAAYAGLGLVAIMGFILILYAAGQLLPEASKEAPPPMPRFRSGASEASKEAPPPMPQIESGLQDHNTVRLT